MNRYPFWKYALILAALALGLLYTLPNLFGEVPAVQVSPIKPMLRTDSALMNRVEEILKKGELAPDGVFHDHAGVKVRLRTPEEQLRAKDLLQTQLGEDYVVALNLLSNSPQWLASIGALPMYLGLDLRGGVHFLLQVDMKTALTKKMESFANDIRGALRDKRIQHGGVNRTDDAISVRFRDAALREKAVAEIGKLMPDLELATREEGSEYRLTATLKPEAKTTTEKFALDQNITTLRNRVNELGVAEPIIQQQGSDRVVVQLPGVQDTAKAKDILGRTATLEIRMVEAHSGDPSARNYEPQKIEQAIAGQVPFGTELFYSQRDSGKEPLLLSKQIVITGDRLTDASPGFDQQDNRPIVSVTLDGQGARIFQQVTREAVKRRMAILLIDRGKPEVLTAPVIQSELGARFQITGFRSTEETKDLALLLRAGALAAPMEIIEERTVGPSLGAENIRKGFDSMWYGFALVAAFMVAYYMLMGVFSILALAANLLFLIALLSMMQATLTLPGIAAIALTLGMAIDANVLINERVREELRNGNTPQAAIHAGYERAWGTIFDSNITTLIAGVALFAFGSGPVKGFAVVHCLGIMTSMFSAVMVSRGMVNLYYGGRRRLDHISIGQVWKPDNKDKREK
jgi:preprotein translocase subunit SecD